MGPIVKELASDYADKSVQFVTFDLTSDETKVASQANAEALGVAATYSEHQPKTGFALLYDTKSQKILTKLSAKNDPAEWREHIDSGLSGS